MIPGTESILPDVTSDAFWHVPADTVPTLVYSVLLLSTLGYWIMSWVNNRTGPFFVTSFYPVCPCLTAVLAYLFLNEHIRYGVYIGGALIASGLYCVVFASKREAELKEDEQMLSH